MNPRHRAREVALQILYRYDVQQQSSGEVPPGGQKLAEDLLRHFDHFQVPPHLREFASQLVTGTLLDRADLDDLLEKHAQNWRLSRMAFIDRNLLRMAIYEMRRFPETPTSVAIDEAVELAKQFGTAETPAFVNGVLDAVKSTVRPAQTCS